MTSEESTTPLWESSDSQRWKACYDHLEKIVEERIIRKRVRWQEKHETLESWFHTELPKALEGRNPLQLSKDEVATILKWKMSHGTYRPALERNFDANNTDQMIKEATKKAFKSLEDEDIAPISKRIQIATEILTELSYVGPGLASAILSLHPSECVPYMSEEAAFEIPDILPPSGKVSWTKSKFVQFASHINAKVAELQTKESTKFRWTERKVADTLWGYHMLREWGGDEWSGIGYTPSFSESEVKEVIKENKELKRQHNEDVKEGIKETSSRPRRTNVKRAKAGMGPHDDGSVKDEQDNAAQSNSIKGSNPRKAKKSKTK